MSKIQYPLRRAVTPLVVAAVLATMSALAVSPAHAEDSAAARVTVRYAELNLQSAAGIQTLYARLKGAARRVCAELDGPSLRERAAYRSCVTSSLERSVHAVRNDDVLAFYNAQRDVTHRS